MRGIAEPHPLFDPTALKTTAVRTPSGYRITGEKSLVPAAADAELFVVAAQPQRQARAVHRRIGLRRLDRHGRPQHGRPGGRAGPVSNSTTWRCRCTTGSARTRRPTLIIPKPSHWPDWVGRALAVGTAHAVLDYAIPYVKEREAFGEPVARRQSVAFMCATIATELDGLRLVTWRGASRAEQGLSFAREAALAKRIATDKGMQIGLDGVQLLGGHGFTKEHPVERWYRDLRAVGVAEGVVVL